jgi:phosphoribosylformimino-5-aminoimidazole carboxamide ribotide isomerase
MSEKRRISTFRPCIDLHDGKVKQIVGGTLNTVAGESSLATNFVSDRTPEYYAELYRRDGLTGGHIIKLGPGNDDAAKAALAAWPGGMQIGGGITADNAGAWLNAGADKVIVTRFVFSGGEFIRSNLDALLSSVGKQHLVLDLSCRKCPDGKYRVVTDRWKNFTTLEVNAATLEMLSGCCAEFLIHAVDVEGLQSGIDEELLAVLGAHSPIECVYAGGVASFEDIAKIEAAGISYTIGSALDIFGGKISYDAVVFRSRAMK